MRTDVKVMLNGELECPNVIQFPVQKYKIASRGDMVQFNRDHRQPQGRGRVIGTVKNPDDGKWYLCVAMQTMSGFCHEYWVDPDSVIDIKSVGGEFADKAKWLFGDEFLDTYKDKARSVSEILYEDLVKADENSPSRS